MKRIKPKDFYLDLPCSVVSIGCASETLHGSFDYGKIKAFSEIASFSLILQRIATTVISTMIMTK